MKLQRNGAESDIPRIMQGGLVFQPTVENASLSAIAMQRRWLRIMGIAILQAFEHTTFQFHPDQLTQVYRKRTTRRRRSVDRKEINCRDSSRFLYNNVNGTCYALELHPLSDLPSTSAGLALL